MKRKKSKQGEGKTPSYKQGYADAEAALKMFSLFFVANLLWALGLQRMDNNVDANKKLANYIRGFNDRVDEGIEAVGSDVDIREGAAKNNYVFSMGREVIIPLVGK